MIYKMIGICDSRHKKDAVCRQSTEPSRCKGCKVACSKYDKLMINSLTCQTRKTEMEVANNESL